MKAIKNWRKASVADIEADNLLGGVTKIHIVGIQLDGRKDVTLIKGSDHQRIRKMLHYHMDNEIPIVFHNGISYDVPVLEKLLDIDLSRLLLLDTLALSWYLNIDHPKHSIEALAESYSTNLEKFQVDPDDWENLSWEDAVKRVTPDVQINKIIWEDFKERVIDMYSRAKTEIDAGAVGGKRVSDDEELYIDSLVGLSVDEHIDRLLTFLMFKMDIIRLQEKTKWKVDLPYIEEHIGKLGEMVDKAAKELEEVMPPVPKYSDRKKPAKPFKKNGELSASGAKWEELKQKLASGEKDKWGNLLVDVRKEDFISELTKYDAPNINGHQQVKDFLTSHGWVPETFSIKRDKKAFQEWINSRPEEGSPRSAWTAWKEARPEDRRIPQVRVDGKDGKDGKELCPSVSRLAEKVPEIRALENYSVIKHRFDTLKGIRDKVDEDGCVEASAHGFTNTLRLKHRAPIVNLPGAKKPYAEPIRGSLVSPSGYVLIGSDLSSLEDRVKIHFMVPHDPEYAAEMSKDTFDPHLVTAVAMGGVTEQQMRDYIEGKLDEEEKGKVGVYRSEAKPVNYLSVYGGTYKALMIQTGWSEEKCKAAIEAYWEKNWAVKVIAEEQCVITDDLGQDWLINPINGFCYSVRSEKDYFSTLAQGTGAFMMDMWLDRVLNKQMETWGRKTLTANMHDELIVCLRNKQSFVDKMTQIIVDSIREASNEFGFRRELGCDVQTGFRYADIH